LAPVVVKFSFDQHRLGGKLPSPDASNIFEFAVGISVSNGNALRTPRRTVLSGRRVFFSNGLIPGHSIREQQFHSRPGKTCLSVRSTTTFRSMTANTSHEYAE